MKKGDKNRKQFHIILTVAMAAVIVLFDVLFLIIPDRQSSDTENRNLQQFPKLSWNTVTQGRFETQFDSYVADQFPARDAWIGIETTIQRFFGSTVSNNIFLGSDGYLIQGFNDPDDEKYDSILSSFSDVIKGHEELGLYALTAPTAVTVLDYRLPANASDKAAGHESAFMDRLFSDLEAMGIKTVDVREDLKNLDRSGTQVYYRTDHHWTTDGAFEAYKAFLQAAGLQMQDVNYRRMMITDSFQGTLTASSGFRAGQTDPVYVYIPEEAQDYIVTNVDNGSKTASVYDLSFLDTRDKYAMFLGGNHAELKIRTSSASERSVLVIKDSYANCFIPFMIPDFGNIVVVDPRYYLGDLDQLINDEGITDILFLNNAETL